MRLVLWGAACSKQCVCGMGLSMLLSVRLAAGLAGSCRLVSGLCRSCLQLLCLRSWLGVPAVPDRVADRKHHSQQLLQLGTGWSRLYVRGAHGCEAASNEAGQLLLCCGLGRHRDGLDDFAEFARHRACTSIAMTHAWGSQHAQWWCFSPSCD